MGTFMWPKENLFQKGSHFPTNSAIFRCCARSRHIVLVSFLLVNISNISPRCIAPDSLQVSDENSYPNFIPAEICGYFPRTRLLDFVSPRTCKTNM